MDENAGHEAAPSIGAARRRPKYGRRRSTAAALGVITSACIGIAIGGLTDAAPARAAPVEVEKTSPGHVIPLKRNPNQQREQYMFHAPGSVPASDMARTLYRVAMPISKVGAWSAPASTLCQTGRFGVAREGVYVVQAKGGSLDVAWGDGRNLHDPTRFASNNKVYMFFMLGTSRCRVYVR